MVYSVSYFLISYIFIIMDPYNDVFEQFSIYLFYMPNFLDGFWICGIIIFILVTDHNSSFWLRGVYQLTNKQTIINIYNPVHIQENNNCTYCCNSWPLTNRNFLICNALYKHKNLKHIQANFSLKIGNLKYLLIEIFPWIENNSFCYFRKWIEYKKS